MLNFETMLILFCNEEYIFGLGFAKQIRRGMQDVIHLPHPIRSSLLRFFKGEALLTKKLVSDMLAPTLLNDGFRYVSSDPGIRMTFGYGIDSVVMNNKIISAKTGGISGFNSYFAYYPKSHTMIVLTANLDNNPGSLVMIVGALFG